jgi:hypothetical protein
MGWPLSIVLGNTLEQ